MNWQSVVEIYGEKQGNHGSGYLVAPGLVLTAQHVVAGLQSTELRLLEADAHGLPGTVGAWQPARVVWSSAEQDLAMLAPAEKQAKFTSLTGTTKAGRLDNRGSTPVRVHALGFPRAMEKPTHSDTLMLLASITPLSGVRSGSLLLKLTEDSPRPASGKDWKGMSGAAVFAGDRLVGVIKAVPTRLDESILAAPVHLMFDDVVAVSILRDAGVTLDSQFVDAAYVDALPQAGDWGGLREQYARAVIESLCSIDDLGLAVSGALERRVPALAVFTAQRLRLWTGQTPDSQ